MVPVVHGETAGWVEAAVGMPMEDVRLTAFRHFVQGIDGDWRNEGAGKLSLRCEMSMKCTKKYCIFWTIRRTAL